MLSPELIIWKARGDVGYVPHDDPEKEAKLAAVHALTNAWHHLRAWRSDIWEKCNGA